MNLRQLCDSDDMHAVAQLILETDPYIYYDLFGNIENAERLLPVFFRKGIAIFKRSSFYVAEEEGQIIGIASLFKSDDIWDEAAVKLVFLEEEVALPPSFYAVSEYFRSVHNYQPGVKACNVCVARQFRNKGYGTAIIKELIRKAGNADVVLTVLSDNLPAIELYKKFGFKTLNKFMDYGGYGKQPVECLTMIRVGDRN